MANLDCYTGGKHDSPDPRDKIIVYKAGEIPSEEHPTSDLREYIHEIYEQGKLHSSSATVLCAAYGMVLQRMAEMLNITHYHFEPSRLFVYYNTRRLNDTTRNNAATSIRDTFKAINRFGICQESFWPYNVERFSQKPSAACYSAAEGNSISEYGQLNQDIDQFRACLKEGVPFIFLMEIYDSFFSMEIDLMMLPSVKEIEQNTPKLHTVLAVGYDDNKQCITVLNSWGKSFGAEGFFSMPYAYIIDPKRTFDFWKIEKITEKGIDILSSIH